ncbi:YopX family protein [Streptococcus suis]|uniref:YopX family protein n=1 Tax=Streptococcus suis TaxID=1307 RepID=UPI00403CBDC5
MVVPKFRAWDKVSHAWRHDIYIGLDGLVKDLSRAGEEPFELPLDNVILMQSTGLFDKNGKEIFEGDVVVVYDELNEFESEVYEIVYSQDNLAWIFYDNESHDFYLISTCTWDELEIIGNAHQNPELLEVNND